MTPQELTAYDMTLKSQNVRLWDVFFIGPMMMWGGAALRRENKLAGDALVVLGGLTVLYNWANHRKLRSMIRAEQRKLLGGRGNA